MKFTNKKLVNKKLANRMKQNYLIDMVNSNSLINTFVEDDFQDFLSKFLGVFIYKGKKTFALKTMDYFYYNLKNIFHLDPDEIFYKIVLNLIPFLVTGGKSHKGRNYYVPIVVKGNKRYVLIIDWIVRFVKDNSNIWGIKRDDVLKCLVDSFYFKGLAVNLKRDQYAKALDSKYNIRRHNSDEYIKLMDKLDKSEKQKQEELRLFESKPADRWWSVERRKNIRRKDFLEWKLKKFNESRIEKGLGVFKKVWVR